MQVCQNCHQQITHIEQQTMWEEYKQILLGMIVVQYAIAEELDHTNDEMGEVLAPGKSY